MENAFSQFLNSRKPTEYTSGIISRTTKTCQIHGEYTCRLIGFLQKGTKFEDGKFKDTYESPCPECERLQNIEKTSLALQDNKWKQEYANAGVPERFKEASLKKFVIYDDKQKQAIKIVKEWINGEFYNLIALGRGGTGKSDLMCASLRNLAYLKHSVKYVTEEQFCSEIKESYSNFNNLTEQSIKEKYYAYDYLVIDEIGRSAGTPKDINLIKTIIINRYENLKHTALASNLDEEELKSRYDEAVYRKLTESSKMFLATWKSYSEYKRSK